MIRWMCLLVFVLTRVSISSAMAQEPAEGEMPLAEEDAIPNTTDSALPLLQPENMATRYGLGLRMRWVSVPSWILKRFAKQYVALSSYSIALEGLRRVKFKDNPTGSWEIAMGIGYQNMTPGDGNWLGKNEIARDNTDFVEVRGLGLITWDLTFVGRQYFGPYFGLHYGAGLGLGVVKGEVLRTSAANCTEQNAGNTRLCKPLVCLGPSCTEVELKASEGQPDLGPDNPHRFKENTIPGAIPILHLLFGLDFPIPSVNGLEFRLEGGLYDVFFLGGTMGYIF